MADTTKEKILKINTQGAEKNVKSLKTQIRELKEQMAQLEKGTEEYDKAAVKLADTLQKQTEITEAAKYSNKDFGAALSTMTSVAQGAVGAISAVNGVMNLMGVEGEEAQEALLKVQSLMAIIQGMGAMDTAIKGIEGLSLAFKGLASTIGMSTKALGIWGIAIAAISAALVALTQHFKKLKEEAKVTLTDIDEKLISMNASAQEVVGSYLLLRNSFVNAKEKGENLSKWVKDHTTELKELNMQNMTMEQYENAFINRTDEYITALTDRYKAEWKLKAAQDKYIENLKDISRWHDLAYKIGIDDYMNHWDVEYTIDGITRTVKEWQEASRKAFIENQHIDEGINEIVGDLENANNKLKEFGTTVGDTGNTSKKTLKELIRLFTELRNKVIDLDLSFNSIATTNDEILKNEQLFVEKLKAIIEKSGIGDSLQEQFSSILKKGNVPLPDNYTSFNIPIDIIFKQEDLDKVNQALDYERKRLGDIVNGSIEATEEEYEEQKRVVAGLEQQVNLRVEIHKAYKDFLKSYEEEMRTIQKISDKEKDYEHLLETTITYYNELRNNNPFAETNRTIADTEYTINKLIKQIERYDEELEKLRTEPITQEGSNREYELLQARIDTEKEIFNLQTTLEDTYFQQRMMDVVALLDAEKDAADEKTGERENRNIKWGQTDNYNSAVYNVQNTIDMIENQIAAVEGYYDELMSQFEENSVEWINLEIEKNNIIEDLEYKQMENSVKLEQEKSKRRLQIAKTYVSAYQSISSQIGSIISAEMDKYDENSKEYKKLKYAQGVMTTAEGVLAAFMSGVESGIPAPGNFVLAGVLSSLALAAGIMQLNNIKNEKLGGSMPNTVDIGSEYDTLSYQTNVDTLSAIQDQKVYVLESDISSTQNRVQVMESQATF